MTENLQWLFSSISEQLFWSTLLESKWCLKIPLKRFITCVMADRGRKKLAKSYLVHKAHAQVNLQDNIAVYV